MHDTSHLDLGYKNGRWWSLIVSEHTLVYVTIYILLNAHLGRKAKKDIRVNYLSIRSRKLYWSDIYMHYFIFVILKIIPKLPLTYSAQSNIHVGLVFFNSKHLDSYQYWTDKFLCSITATIGGICLPSCDGLTPAGCKVPAKNVLSLPSSTGPGRQNRMKGLWVRIRKWRDHSFSITGKTGLTSGN